MGAGIALELSRRCLRVLVCEQHRAPGRGATSLSGGLVRQHHTAHCDTKLAVRSLPIFQRWPDVIGGDCGYRQTGFAVVVAGHHRERLERNVAAVNRAGGTSGVIDVSQLAAHYPALAFADAEEAGLVAAYEPDGGYVDATAATLSLVAAATRAGARYGEGVVVSGVATSGDVVRGVQTNVGTIAAPLVVLAAGAWSARLTAPLGVELPFEARRIGLAHGIVDAQVGPMPSAIDDTLGTYFRPDDTGHGLHFGVALEGAVDLDHHPMPVDRYELETARKTVAVRVPAAGSTTIGGTRAGLDGYTPDHHPVIGPVGPDGLYLCAGFSGGGVKTMPAVAREVAAEIVQRKRSDLLEPYRPQRFATGSPITSDDPYEYI